MANQEIKQFKQLIGDAWCESSEGTWIETENPYTGRVWAKIPRATVADVNAAISAARTTFFSTAWKSMFPSERGKLLVRLADLILENQVELASAETADNGKLIVEMSTQVKYLAEWFRYFGGLADKIEGRVLPIDKTGMLTYTRQVPLGVIAAITPWNSPLLLATWKLAPALAAGNTIVWKPSEFSSVSALIFGQLFKEAGFPDGAVNIVTGYGHEIGDALVQHDDVSKVAFTGGDATGQRVYESAAKGIKEVTLELGGKSANIVFGDANIDNAVKGVISGIFAASGQTCIAGSRALVHRSIYDEFVSKLVDFAKAAKIGDPSDVATQVGPITTGAQFNKVMDYISIGKGEGATCALGGKAATGSELDGGRFVEPTVFIDVAPDMRIANEEIFGPVLAVIPFDSDEEAVQIANDTQYGLAAGIWTSSLQRALALPEHLEAGTVWVNTYRAVSFMAPFGGFKRSGIGRENGIEAINQYLQTRTVWIDTTGETANPFVVR